MSSNTYGRQVVLPLTNKSGGGVIAGDVVVSSATAADSFTTTTSAGFTGMIGIAQETIANNAVGRVLVSGYAPLVNVAASVTILHFGLTHTVAKQATSSAARAAGTFCQFLTGGTTPDAVVYPSDLAAAALTNPMNAVGDIIQGTTAGAPARLGAGTAGFVLTSAGAATPLVWAAPSGGTALVAASLELTTGNVTTTSTTFVDATGITLTLTTGAHRCMVYLNGSWALGSTGTMGMDLMVDGTRVAAGSTHGSLLMDNASTNSSIPFSIIYQTAVLSAAAHTIKVQWKVSSGTGTIYAGTTGSVPLRFIVMETALTI